MADDCYCDYEPWDAGGTTSRRARLTHKCDECHGTILPGETYESTWSVYEGSFNTNKACQRCVALREWVKAHVPCFCWYFECLLENAIDTVREYAWRVPGMWMEFGRMLVAIKRHKESHPWTPRTSSTKKPRTPS